MTGRIGKKRASENERKEINTSINSVWSACTERKKE